MDEIVEILFTADVSVKYSRSKKYKMSEPHFHDGYEVQLTLSNDTVYLIEDRHYCAKAGTVVALAAGEVHRVYAPVDGFYERYILSVRPQFLCEFSATCPELIWPFMGNNPNYSHCSVASESETRALVKCFQTLIDCLKTPPQFAPDLKKKLATVQLLLRVGELSCQVGSAHPNMPDEKIQEMIKHINENLSDKFYLDDLAKRFYISKSSLIQSFKNATGLTPHSYAVYMKIMQARNLLRKDLSLSDVCAAIGFEDESSFIRCFKKIVGVTPKQFSLSYKGLK